MVQASDDHALSRQFKSTRHARADQTGSHRSAVQLDGRLVRATRVQLELLALLVVPAIMPLSWDSVCIGSRCLVLLISVCRNRGGTGGDVACKSPAAWMVSSV